MNDFFWFAVFPYVAVAIELVLSFYRYFTNSYKFSSLSSGFLEGKTLFWGSVPWHFGILTILLGHLIGFLFPRHILLFNGSPLRFAILEVTALVGGLFALFGLVVLIYRRFTNGRVSAVTSKSDVLVLFLLLTQVVSGLGIALSYRWGSSWYAASLVPYLKSVFVFAPDLTYISSLPPLVKWHVFNAVLLVAVLPFTRLIHFLVLPIHYIWRSWQVVRWNWNPKTIRKRNIR